MEKEEEMWSKPDSALPSCLSSGLIALELADVEFSDSEVIFEPCPEGDIDLDLAALNFSDHSLLMPKKEPEPESESDDWRLTRERRDEFFRSAEPSYANRRHLNRFGD